MTTTRNMTNQIHLKAAGLSVCGPKRANNQDTIYFDVSRIASQPAELGLFIVCDGLGGLQAGEFASRIAIKVIVSALTTNMSQALEAGDHLQPETIQRLLNRAISAANATIADRASELPEPGARMGTTITLALVYDGLAHIAHVGDSRLYLLRHNQITQITDDHSFAAELARHGQITAEQVMDHPHKNVLTRALGVGDEVEIDHYQIELRGGDRLLLCSDGLWQTLATQNRLVDYLLASQEDPETQVKKLVAQALKQDGSDNVSGVVVEFSGATETDSPTTPKHQLKLRNRQRPILQASTAPSSVAEVA